jgi:hypothetical protein
MPEPHHFVERNAGPKMWYSTNLMLETPKIPFEVALLGYREAKSVNSQPVLTISSPGYAKLIW